MVAKGDYGGEVAAMGVGSLGDLWAWAFMPMVGTHGHGGRCWHGFRV